MGAIDDLKNAFRDYQTADLPSSGANEPDKAEIRAGLDKLGTEMSAIANDMLVYETKAAMDANTGEDDGALARVWDDATAANNTVYQWNGAAWEEATWYFDSVAAVVQPLVDAAEDAAEAAEESATEFVDFRDETLSVNDE